MNSLKLIGLASAGIFASTNCALAADWTFSGMLREEVAVKLTDDQNPFNQAGNEYNGVAVKSTGLAPGTLTRPASQAKSGDFNMFATRLELNLDGKLTDDWAVHFKMRGISDQVGKVNDAFKDQNLFEQQYGNNRNAGGLGAAGKDWMLDLPVAYADYNSGPVWLRIGNQQIAWGEAMFFRVADVANGLDLRRHSGFDVAAEEFSDKRVSSLGIRGTYRVADKTQLEGFVQQFRPSVLPGANAPYNPVPAQFVIDQKTGYEKVKDEFNFGLRLQTEIEDIGIQAFAVRRNNPDGVLRWTEAQGKGAISGTPFATGTSGIYSAQEWFRYASLSRLDGVGGLLSALNQFSGTTTGPLAGAASFMAGACGASNSTPGAIAAGSAAASCILDTFFDPATGFGNLQGWLVREYPRENVFGFALNKVFSGEPDSITDQLIGRFELSYTPNKKFTNPTLSKDYIVKDELNFAFIAEKYHKFSQALPATYMVFQWMHKSDSDLFGRSLMGSNNTAGQVPNGKKNGSDYIAVVLQQPSPSLEWRFDLALLTDMNGGWFVQPGTKWKVNKDFQVDIYANYLRSGNNGKDFAEGYNYAREMFVRGSWYF
ncbi:DUF1302 family protein [Dechloromonas sp. CZR5]|uniref:DUF1302 family protein n=1 Tax=Dechloromonas sp. CZR5 TaxID=2608630 RepID=UPI00123E1938|nr:DUF1302 family protein [Dechloromonas sp. CZR5]